MKIIEQSWVWLQKPENPLITIENAGRTCYKSEDKVCDGSAKKFTNMIVRSGHETVIEHVSASLRIITNRGVTHELVRHRLASFSQESTRYVKYDGTMEFIKPVWCSDDVLGVFNEVYDFDKVEDETENLFCASLYSSESDYQQLLERGWRPEQAREVLPNSLKTEIVMTCNLREWRHIFNMRCQKAAHPQIRSLFKDILKGFHTAVPVVFDDLYEKFIL